MNETKIQVLQIAETFMQGAVGQSVPAIKVTFKVGTHGPFTETFAKSEYTAAVQNQRLEAFAAQIRQATGGAY